MGNILICLIYTLGSGFQKRALLLAEILALRHQLAILKRSAKKCPRLRKSDRFLWLWRIRRLPDWQNSLLIGYCQVNDRKQERQMRRFKSPQQSQRFLSVHGPIQNLFRVGRHDLNAVHDRLLSDRAFIEWRESTCAC